MRVLIDTHIALWSMLDEQIPKTAKEMMDAADEVFVSSASIWEVSIKASVGKMLIDVSDFSQQLIASGFTPLPVTWAHAVAVRALPFHHRDSFDRILVAQAMTEPLQLITHDIKLAAYSPLVVVV